MGTPTSIKFKNEDKFNFAFDLVDALADREPEKLAILHISKDKNESLYKEEVLNDWNNIGSR